MLLIGRLVGEMVGFVDREHAFGFVTPSENVRSMSGSNESLLKVLPEWFIISMLLNRMPSLPCGGQPATNFLLNVLVPKSIDFFMVEKLKRVMSMMEIVGGI